MAKVFAFCNQKGGVGKTTSVVNLSVLLSKAGLKVLIVDLDAQGNSTSGFGIDKSTLKSSTYEVVIGESSVVNSLIKAIYENTDILPSKSSLAGAEIELVNEVGREFILKERLVDIASSYDAVLIDCPPSLGILTINALTSADYLIIPLQCEYYALEGLGQLLHTFKLVKSKINRNLEIGGIILTMADTRTNLTTQVIEEVRKHFPDNMFQSIIPRSVRISEAPSFGKPVVLYAPESRGSQSYKKLAVEFKKRFFGEAAVKSSDEKLEDAPSKTPIVKEDSQPLAKEEQVV